MVQPVPPPGQQGQQAQQGQTAQQGPQRPPLIGLTVQDIFFLMTFVLTVLQTLGEIPFYKQMGLFKSSSHYSVTPTSQVTVDIIIRDAISALKKELSSTSTKLAYVEVREKQLKDIYFSYYVMEQQSKGIIGGNSNHTNFGAALKRLFQEIRTVALNKQDLLSYQKTLQESRDQLTVAKKLSTKTKIELTSPGKKSTDQPAEKENAKDEEEKQAEEKAQLWPLSMLVGYTALLIGFMIVRNIHHHAVQYFLCVSRDIMMCGMLSTVCYRGYVLASAGILKGASLHAAVVIGTSMGITWVVKLNGYNQIVSLFKVMFGNP